MGTGLPFLEGPSSLYNPADGKVDAPGPYLRTLYFLSYHQANYTDAWNYNVRKLMQDASSIDTRKVYGQPMLTGELTADPNAPLRSVTFNPWLHKGGLFVGNMPNGSNDLSGTSRIQIYGNGNFNSSTTWATLSLLYEGPASSANNPLTVVAGCPSPTDSNITVASNAVGWSTGWSNSTMISLASGTLNSSTPIDDYFCLELPPVIQTTAGKALAMLMMQNEDPTAQAWHYFESPAFQALYPSLYPRYDGQPRIWSVDLNYTTWNN